MSRQFVAVKFRSGDARAYTYHFDGDAQLWPGAIVKVPDRSGDGWQRATVDEINVPAPTAFATKAILGLVLPEDVAAPTAVPVAKEMKAETQSLFDDFDREARARVYETAKRESARRGARHSRGSTRWSLQEELDSRDKHGGD